MGKRPRMRGLTDGRSAQWTFFRQWLKNPLSIAAISPSGRQLTQQMLAELPDGCERVIELGGGTGVFTRALLDFGIEPANLLVLELNEELHQHLSQRFPGTQVVCGDARDLPRVAERAGYLARGPVGAVVSGLGLLSMNKPTQRAILGAAFQTLAPDGRFIQFTYGPSCPVSRDVVDQLGLTVRRAGVAWRNVPPATVYVFSRSRSKAIRPTSMRTRDST